MGYPISELAWSYVRNQATELMSYTCRIERVNQPTFNQTLGTAIPGGRTIIYEGPCRLWEVTGGSSVTIAEDDVVMNSTQLSIPWDSFPVPKRNDEVQVLSSRTDQYLVGRRFVIDSSAKAGELRATRRFTVRGMEAVS